MANKSIKQYNEITDTQTGTITADKDAVLVQRGTQYYWIDPVNLRLGVQKATLTLNDTQIKASNTTPIEIVSAPGAGKYIIPLPTCFAKRAAGTAYATQTSLRTRFTGAADADYYHNFNAILAGTADLARVADYANADNEDLQENTALEVYAPTADPTTGTGNVTVVVYYLIAEL